MLGNVFDFILYHICFFFSNFLPRYKYARAGRKDSGQEKTSGLLSNQNETTSDEERVLIFGVTCCDSETEQMNISDEIQPENPKENTEFEPPVTSHPNANSPINLSGIDSNMPIECSEEKGIATENEEVTPKNISEIVLENTKKSEKDCEEEGIAIIKNEEVAAKDNSEDVIPKDISENVLDNSKKCEKDCKEGKS